MKSFWEDVNALAVRKISHPRKIKSNHFKASEYFIIHPLKKISNEDGSPVHEKVGKEFTVASKSLSSMTVPVTERDAPRINWNKCKNK